MTDDLNNTGQPPTAQSALPESQQLVSPEIRPSLDLRAPVNGELPPSWGFLDVVAVIGAAVLGWLVSVIGLFVYMMVRKMTPQQVIYDVRVILVPQIVVYALAFVTMYLLVGTRSGRPFWKEIRWNWPRRSWVFYIPAGLVLAIAASWMQSHLPTPKEIPMMKFLSNAGSAYALGLIAVFGAPIMEELFFRGLLYPVMARKLKMWPSVVVIGLLFGLLHASQLGWAWGYVLVLSFVGAVLTTVRALSRSLASSVILHTFYNTTIFVSMWITTDHFKHMEKATSMILFKP